MTQILWRAQRAETWQAREAALGEAYEHLARRHNRLGITQTMPEKVYNFHTRPFKVIHGEAFAQAIRGRISDPEVQRITEQGLIGSIDQFSDSTDLRSDPSWRPALREIYGSSRRKYP